MPNARLLPTLPLAAALLGLAMPSAASAESPLVSSAATWDDFQAASAPLCVGLRELMAKPETKSVGKYEYTFEGYRAKVRKKGEAKADELRFGVVAGIKELNGPNRKALRGFFDKFLDAGVFGVIVGGDSGTDRATLEPVFTWLAKHQLPVFVVAGNWESVGAFNDTLRSISKDYPNVINMDLARRVDLDGVDLVSMGGYLDRAYAKDSGACIYSKDELDGIRGLAGECDDPVVLVSHGPPRQDGSDAIDFVPGVGNVGDAEMAAAISESRIRYGIFGHILEAGGRATNEEGREVAPGQASKALFLNPGLVAARVQKLNAGGSSHGLAAILTLRRTSASYEVLRAGDAE